MTSLANNRSDVAFLKVATASPDFENVDIEGIPDSFSGPTFVKKDYAYTSVTAPAGRVTYVLVPPTMGVAYYTVSVDLVNGEMPSVNDYFGARTLNFKGTTFPDAGSLFPGVNIPDARVTNSNNVVRGRMMGQSAELVVLNNAFHQYGSITTFKTPLNRTVIEEFDTVNDTFGRYQIVGTPALVAPIVFSNANVAPVREGSYAVAMSREAEFNFADVLDDVSLSSKFEGYVATPPTTSAPAVLLGPAVLWDNGFDSIVFRIVVPPSVETQSFILKVYKTWELQPAANSLAASIAHASPPQDERALKMYHQISRDIPVSVPAKDNPDFWNKVVDGLHSASGALSNVPIVSKYAQGVHALTTLGKNLGRKKSKPKPVVQVVKAATKKPPARRKPKGQPKRKR